MPERCVVENLLARASEVEVKPDPTGEPKKCMRIGLGNGHYTKFFQEFCEFAELEETEAEKFLGRIIARLKQSGMIKKVADHEDCPQFGILELLVKQEEILLIDIETRTEKTISGTMRRLLDGLEMGSSVFDGFPSRAKAILGVFLTSDDCNRLRWRLTRTGVIVRLDFDAEEKEEKTDKYWLSACPEFSKHVFVSDGKEEEWAQSLDGVKVAGSPERLRVIVLDFLTSRRADLKSTIEQSTAVVVDCREKFAEAQKALIEVAQAGGDPDLAEYTKTKVALEKAEAVVIGKDSSLLEKYESVIADLSLSNPETETPEQEVQEKPVTPPKPAPAKRKPRKAKQPAKKPGRKKQPPLDPEKVVSSPWFKNLTTIDKVLVCVYLKFGRDKFSSLQVVAFVESLTSAIPRKEIISSIGYLGKRRKSLKSFDLTIEDRQNLSLSHQTRHLYQMKVKVCTLVKQMLANASL